MMSVLSIAIEFAILDNMQKDRLKHKVFREVKAKSDAKTELGLLSDKQKHLDESGEAEIRYEDAWIADVYEP